MAPGALDRLLAPVSVIPKVENPCAHPAMSSKSQPNCNSALSSGSKHRFSYGTGHSLRSTDPENCQDSLLLDNSDDQSQHEHDDMSYHDQDENRHDYNFNASASLRSLSHHAASIRVSMSRSLREFVDAGFVPDGSLNVSIRTFEGGATVASEVANVAKNLIGMWVLTIAWLLVFLEQKICCILYSMNNFICNLKMNDSPQPIHQGLEF